MKLDLNKKCHQKGLIKQIVRSGKSAKNAEMI